MNGMPEERRESEYADTMEALRRAESVLPDFSTSYDGEIQRLYEQIVSRPAFRYDPGSDPLYRSYRDQMVSEGSRAMRDTMGQAAALTGGYGSSYAESVGQQQYGLYLQKLGQAMPELYKAAYDRYSAEGDAMRADFDMAKGLADSEYGRKRDRFNQAATLEKQQYERGEKSYQKLVSLISESGYQPSDAELRAAGMTRAQAEALRNDYLQKNPLALVLSGAWAASVGGGGESYSYGGGASSSAGTAGTKEQTKLAANQKGSGSGKKRRL
jgi:hypothetical protein